MVTAPRPPNTPGPQAAPDVLTALRACESGIPDDPLAGRLACGFAGRGRWLSNLIPQVNPMVIPQVNPHRNLPCVQMTGWPVAQRDVKAGWPRRNTVGRYAPFGVT